MVLSLRFDLYLFIGIKTFPTHSNAERGKQLLQLSAGMHWFSKEDKFSVTVWEKNR